MAIRRQSGGRNCGADEAGVREREVRGISAFTVGARPATRVAYTHRWNCTRLQDFPDEKLQSQTG